jgi:hypothetical protein
MKKIKHLLLALALVFAIFPSQDTHATECNVSASVSGSSVTLSGSGSTSGYDANPQDHWSWYVSISTGDSETYNPNYGISITFSGLADGTYTYQGYDWGDPCDSGSFTIDTYVPPSDPDAWCSMSVSPTTVYTGNTNATLSWSTSDADSVYINNGIGWVGSSGSTTVSPSSTTTYNLTAYGEGSGANDYCSRTVTVTDPPVECNISASPTSIREGGSTTLTWSSSDAVSASINQGIGAVSTNGSMTVSPTDTTRYTITMTAPAGKSNAKCSRAVTVTPPNLQCTLGVSPATVSQGTLQTVSWTTQDATSATINCIDSVTPLASGSAVVGLENDRNYTMTVLGPKYPDWVSDGTLMTGVPDIGYESAPAFADLDNDGDFDLFVGESTGVMNAYENTGTASAPAWTVNRTLYSGISDIGLDSAPAFADLDNDGDFDLFVGESAGVMNAYENTGTASAPAWTANATFATGIPDIGSGSMPAFADLDNDGDFDLFVGESAGVMNAYENTGTASAPAWTANATFATGIPDIGSDSAPVFADLDGDGDFDVLIGNDGVTRAYRNSGTVSAPSWTARTIWDAPDMGSDGAPALADLDNDGDVDLFTGENNGKMNAHKSDGSNGTVTCNAAAIVNISAIDAQPREGGLWDGWSWTERTSQLATWFTNNILKRTTLLTKPWDDAGYDALTLVEKKGEQLDWQYLRRRVTDVHDVFVLNANEKVQNSHATREYFIPEKTATEWNAVRSAIVGGQVSDLSIVPIDECDPDAFRGGVPEPVQTGDYDLVIGTALGTLVAYENTGSKSSPTWTLKSTWVTGIADVGAGATPTFADIDNDGDYDVFIGEDSGLMNAYENTGSDTSPTWVVNASWVVGIPDIGGDSVPAFADIDNDGDYDIFIAESNGLMNAYENTGTASVPAWTVNTGWKSGIADAGDEASVDMADLDNDGDIDMIIGNSLGKGLAYENTGSASSPSWAAKTAWNLPDSGNESQIALADLDDDGDIDALVGKRGGQSVAYENTGSASSPSWAAKTAWDVPDVGDYASPECRSNLL